MCNKGLSYKYFPTLNINKYLVMCCQHIKDVAWICSSAVAPRPCKVGGARQSQDSACLQLKPVKVGPLDHGNFLKQFQFN